MTARLSRPTSDVTTTLAECPYRGLQPYGEEDAEYYFGRDRERDLVIANVMATRLTVLYGPSGVGKSSLLRAGVVHLLTRLPASSFSYLAVGNTVVVYQAAWRDDPLSALGDALRAAVRKEPDSGAYEPAAGPLSLQMVADVSRSLDADVFLVLDQFEEESLYCGPEATEALAVELGRIVGAQGVRASVLIGIREDSLAKLDTLEAHVPGLFDNTLRLDHLDAAEARQAIEQPLVRYNAGRPKDQHVTIEPELVDELLAQLRTGRLSVTDAGRGGGDGEVTIETPFLQLVMTRLWTEERLSGSPTLQLSTLRRLGDAEHIVRTHLDHVMEQLSPEDRRIAAMVFRYLVTPSGMKIAHTTDDLAQYAGLNDASALTPVLEDLSSGRERILRPVEPPLDRPGVLRYEIFHDVLASAILDWRRRFVTEQDRIQSEQRLVQEREDARREHEQTRRRLRRSRLFSAALVVLLVAALASGILAKVQADTARATALLSQSADLLDRDPALALARAVDAQLLRGTPESELKVRTAMEADHERLRITSKSGFRDVIAFSPDGRSFVAAGSSPTVVLYDVATGRLLREIGLEQGVAVNWAGFSRDASMVALTTDEGRTTVYDTRSGKQLLVVQPPADDYIATSRWIGAGEEQTLLSAGKGDSVDEWQPRTGESITSFGDRAVTDYDEQMETSADGSKVVTKRLEDGDDGSLVSTLRVWDTRTGKLLAQSANLDGVLGTVSFLGKDAATVALWFKPDGGYWTPSFWQWRTQDTLVQSGDESREGSPMSTSSDGSALALTQDKNVRVYTEGDAEADSWLPEQPDLLNAISLSPDGTQVLTAGVAGQAKVWRVGQGPLAPLQTLRGHGAEIADAQFSPTDPNLVLTAGYDRTVRLWQLPARPVAATVGSWMTAADVAADGRIVSVSDTGRLSIADARDGQESTSAWVTWDDRADFSKVEWLADGEHVAVAATQDWAPWVWDPGGEELPRQLDWHTSWTQGLAASPDRGLIAMGDDNNTVVVWDAESGHILHTLEGGDASFRIMDVVFVPGTSQVAAASVDGTVRVWDLSHPEKVSRVIGGPGAAPVVGVTVSDDGRWLAVTSVDRVIRLHGLSHGLPETEPVLTFRGPVSGLGDLTFTPDGARLVGAAGDGTVSVWERESGHLVTVQRTHGDSVNSVSVMPDGRLLTASDDGTTLISECTTCGDFQDVLRRAQARVAAHEKGMLSPLDGQAPPPTQAAAPPGG